MYLNLPHDHDGSKCLDRILACVLGVHAQNDS